MLEVLIDHRKFKIRDIKESPNRFYRGIEVKRVMESLNGSRMIGCQEVDKSLSRSRGNLMHVGVEPKRSEL